MRAACLWDVLVMQSLMCQPLTSPEWLATVVAPQLHICSQLHDSPPKGCSWQRPVVKELSPTASIVGTTHFCCLLCQM